MQIILLNEFDKKESGYQKFAIEAQLRILADNFNAYVIGLFVCGRQIYDKDFMTGL